MSPHQDNHSGDYLRLRAIENINTTFLTKKKLTGASCIWEKNEKGTNRWYHLNHHSQILILVVQHRIHHLHQLVPWTRNYVHTSFQWEGKKGNQTYRKKNPYRGNGFRASSSVMFISSFTAYKSYTYSSGDAVRHKGGTHQTECKNKNK